jgi:hypothetical protein
MKERKEGRERERKRKKERKRKEGKERKEGRNISYIFPDIHVPFIIFLTKMG